MAAGDGLVSMTPSSIAHSGTSASINADGGVDFTAVTSLSLNGVFTGDYDNYLIVMQFTTTATSELLSARLRSAGTDASGASTYVYQVLSVTSTSVSGARTTTDKAAITAMDAASRNGLTLHIYGPALSQATAMRGVSEYAVSSAAIYDIASTHSTASSYDGISLLPNSGSITGNIHVFGYEE